MDKAKELFQAYVTAAEDLAESVKRNIQKDGTIDNKTVLKLNDFIIAQNAIAEADEHELGLNSDANETNETDETLN